MRQVGKVSAALGTMGNAEFGSLIRNVVAKETSGAEKTRLLADGAKKLRGVKFDRMADVPGAEAVFRGASRSIDGKFPILAVLKDGSVLRGLSDALIPDPSGKTGGLRLLRSGLEKLQ